MIFLEDGMLMDVSIIIKVIDTNISRKGIKELRYIDPRKIKRSENKEKKKIRKLV